MTQISVTGGDGFLGWHLRCALGESGTEFEDIPVGSFFDQDQATRAIDGSSRLIHLAGVNRGTEDEIRAGNVQFATQISDVLQHCAEPPRTIVYANSIQSELDNPYGHAKAKAANILSAAASAVGAEFVDVRFPNLFGEHGKPFYNSVTATFCHLLATGGTPQIEIDRELPLLHAQDAADILIGNRAADSIDDLTTHETVSGLLSRLQRMSQTYAAGEIPDVADPFDRNLFNTYRSFLVSPDSAIPLTKHSDPRGGFCEVLRVRGGSSQMSFSTTVPGFTRGNHYHRRKMERFVVVAGTATISLRKHLTDQTIDFHVSGDRPVAIDMPTMWVHNITNTGRTDMYATFWTNELFDPEHPDTIPAEV